MMRADLRRIVLFGAIGRHNFGDLLMAEVHAALINNTGLSPPIFADLLAADMTSVGGRQVVAVGSLFEDDTVTDLIHIGGDILGAQLTLALSMLNANAEQTAAVMRQMQPAGKHIRSGYLLPKTLLKNPGAFITNAVGGWLSGPDARALDEFDFASSRNKVKGMRLVPDSVVLLRQLLDHRVVERAHAPAQQAVRHAMKGRGYWAVQINKNTGTRSAASNPNPNPSQPPHSPNPSPNPSPYPRLASRQVASHRSSCSAPGHLDGVITR